MSATALQDFSQPDVENISLVCEKPKAIVEQALAALRKPWGSNTEGTTEPVNPWGRKPALSVQVLKRSDANA